MRFWFSVKLIPLTLSCYNQESLLKKHEQDQLLKSDSTTDISSSPLPEAEVELSVQNLTFGPLLSKGSSAAVFAGKWNEPEGSETESEGQKSYPLAIKMMFNYDFESNSSAIFRAMCKEIVPCKELPNLRGITIE